MRFLAAVLLALAPALATASSTTTDFSDLWFNPGESGWGVNIIQQRSTLFATLFVYDQAGRAQWYVASEAMLSNTSGGILTFSGTLYRTTGPYFGASTFDPGQVGVTPVGSFAFAAGAISTGAISYTVDGVQVTKTVQRQTWAGETLTGIYVGSSTGTWSGCGTQRNGYAESPAVYTVSHDGSVVQIREDGNGFTCNYTAGYSQAGRFGSLSGNGSCSDGIAQGFVASEVHVGLQALTMRAQFTQASGCTFVGRLGGMRRAP